MSDGTVGILVVFEKFEGAFDAGMNPRRVELSIVRFVYIFNVSHELFLNLLSQSCPSTSATSIIRLENPHSLSYHAEIFPIYCPITFVKFVSIIAEAGL